MKLNLKDIARVVYEAHRAVSNQQKAQIDTAVAVSQNTVPFEALDDDSREELLAEVRTALDGGEAQPLTTAIVTALK